MLDHLFRRDRGQGLVDYAIILALVVLVIILVLIVVSPSQGSIFSNTKIDM